MRNQQTRASGRPSSRAAAGLFSNPTENEDFGPDWDSDLDSADPSTVEGARRLLGVAASSTPAQIKGAYRHLARMYHPDCLKQKSSQAQQTATSRMIAINKAYCLLGNGRSTQPKIS